MPAEYFSSISNQKTPPTYNYFDGKDWMPSTSGKVDEITSPIDGSVVGSVQVVTHKEIDKAIKRATDAQAAWEKTSLNERVKIMHLVSDWIMQYEDFLTGIMVKEIGKSQKEAKSEIKRTAELTDYYADEVQSIRGETLDSDNFPGYEKGRLCVIQRAAHGVVLAIAPFNYPVNLSASKIVPALLMGNTVVFKPPTQGAILGLHLARIFQKAGVPEGVVACVTGGGSQIGDYLVEHPGIKMVTFTGSSDTGAHIGKKAGMKPLLFECGGNNPAIVLPDADMNLTAKELVKGSFSYAGQRCTAIKYVLATQGVMDQIVPKILKVLKTDVKMGDPRNPETKMVGPVVSLSAAKNIEAAIKSSVKDGAKILAGGKRDNAFIEPTILMNVKPEMKSVCKEVFGPVLSLITVKSNEEIINIIKSSNYGLQASIFTKDEGSGLVLAEDLDVGTVQINGSPQRGPDHFPFLGIKGSGVGVQGVRYSLEAMSRYKSTVINKPQ
ncbi:aldehyde dehydrogenase family protein [Patescibacteria group bacterium]